MARALRATASTVEAIATAIRAASGCSAIVQSAIVKRRASRPKETRVAGKTARAVDSYAALTYGTKSDTKAAATKTAHVVVLSPAAQASATRSTASARRSRSGSSKAPKRDVRSVARATSPSQPSTTDANWTR